MDHERDGDGPEFRLLGPLELWLDGRRQRVAGPRQRRVLAAVLLNAGRVTAAEALVDAVWGSEPPDTARRQVHNAVAALRRQLPALRPLLVSDDPGYRLDLPQDRVDVHRFTSAVEAARALAARPAPADRAAAAHGLRSALRLWRGPALDGVVNPLRGPIEAAAARLDEQRLDAHELLAELRLAQGESAALVPELTALLDAHPLREGFAAGLMLALYRSGQQPKALEVFDRTRATLAEELGIDPRPDLRALHQRMLRGDPTLTPAPAPPPPSAPVPPAPAPARPTRPDALPYDIADFTGRRAEVEAVLRHVGGHAAATPTPTATAGLSLTVLHGMAGIGKTTLAVRVAHLAADHYPDGRLFLNLHGHSAERAPLTPDAALALLLRQLGVPPEQIPEAHEDRVARWRSQLAGRRTLVVLDNAADEAQVRPLLPGAATAAVLVTSRRRLTALEGARAVPLDVLPHDEAVALFRNVAQRPVVGARDAAHAEEVVTLCGHLPLAIRIAASRLQHRPAWTVAHLAHRLRDERRRLAELTAGDRDVRAAFAVSHQQLATSEQTLFRRLGLHPGPDLDAYDAAALLGHGTSAEEAEILLEELCSAHLLTEHTAGRYHLHDLVASYARALAAADDEPAAGHTAACGLARYYLRLGQAIERLVDPGGEIATADAAVMCEDPAHAHGDAALPPLHTVADAKSAVVRGHRAFAAVIEHAHAHGLAPQAARLALTLGSCLLRHGYLEEALTGLAAGLDAARAADAAKTQAALHRLAGFAHVSTGRFAEALQAFRQGLAIERARGDVLGAGRTLRIMSSAHYRLGHYREALDTLLPVVEQMRRDGSARDVAVALANIGVVYTQLGAYDRAIAAHRETLRLEPDSHAGRAVTLFNLGWAHSRRGDLAMAEAYMRDSLRLNGQAGSVEQEARSRAHLADCLRRQGRSAEALQECRAALDLAEGIDGPDVRSLALIVLGDVHLGTGDLAAARTCFDQALRTTEDTGLSHRRAGAHDGRARVAAAEDDTPLARHHWTLALTLADECGVPEATTIRRHLTALGALHTTD